MGGREKELIFSTAKLQLAKGKMHNLLRDGPSRILGHSKRKKRRWGEAGGGEEKIWTAQANHSCDVVKSKHKIVTYIREVGAREGLGGGGRWGRGREREREWITLLPKRGILSSV